MADPIPKYPLYDATYTAYRASPLYHGSNPLLDETTLRMHARRLRDILRGNILRGVDIGGGADDSSSGTLENCTWDLLGDEESWERLHSPDAQAEEEQPGELTDGPSLDPSAARGIYIELRYQKATYTALLLRDTSAASLEPPTLPDFTALPLLLTRMPAALRAAFTTYLTTTFDARLTPLHLPTPFLSRTLETLLAALSSPSSILARLQLQLAFPTACPTSALRAIDITLPRADIEPFLARGGDDDDALSDAAPNNSKNNVAGPLTTALAAYLRAHLALDLAHPGVHVAKIALPPLLALSADGRVKVFGPWAAAQAAPEPERVSVEALKGVVEGVWDALVRAAGVGVEATTVVVVGRGKGKGKEKEKAGAAVKGKGRKRALAAGDANAGHGKRRADAAEGSPGKKRLRRPRTGGIAVAEEGEERDEDANGGEAEEGEIVASSAGTTSQRLSVPQEPPPPYELHDPAIVAGRR